MKTPTRYVVLIAAAAAIAAGLFAGPATAPSVQALYDDADGDGATDIAETYLGSDPEDPASSPEDIFSSYFSGGEECYDGIDNDGDGRLDEDDSGCLDTDFDGLSDPLERALGQDPEIAEGLPEDSRLDAILSSFGRSYDLCDNGYDDDGDGAEDGVDPGCVPITSDADAFDDAIEKLFGSDPDDASSVPEHELANPGSCSDGADNDRDGALDGADPGCATATNDDFDDAEAIATVPFSDQVKLSTATVELGEPESQCGGIPPDAASVWYRYTPPSQAALAAEINTSRFSAIVAVWTRSDDRFHDVACSYARGFEPGEGRVPFYAQGGETYYIQVVGYVDQDEPADLQFSVITAHPPANDLFANARQVSALPFEDTFDATDATFEDGEAVSDCAYKEAFSSVWYRYTPGADQLVVLGTPDSEFSARAAVWTDSQFGLAEVECGGSRGRIAVDMAAGRTYYIQVFAREPGEAAQGHLAMELSAPPPNDDFADATNAAPLPFSDTVDTFTASAEPGEPEGPEGDCSYIDEPGSVWYRVTAPRSGYITASVQAGSFDFVPVSLAAYTGSSVSSLTLVTCAEEYYEGPRAFATAVDAGQTLYIRVSTEDGYDVGEISVHIDFLDVPSCPAAEFTVEDPRGDPFTFGPASQVFDVTSLSAGDDGTNYCIRIQFDRAIPGSAADPIGTGSIGFDTDSNHDTGPGAVDFPCGYVLSGQGHGNELGIRFVMERDVIVPLAPEPPFPFLGGSEPPAPTQFAFLVWGERSLQVIVPMEALGDDQLYLDVSFNGEANVDCVPNGGAIRSPDPGQPGDVNCDDRTDSVDASLILQRVAGLLASDIICQYLGDVNASMDTGPIDAALILQFSSGLLPGFS